MAVLCDPADFSVRYQFVTQVRTPCASWARYGSLLRWQKHSKWRMDLSMNVHDGTENGHLDSYVGGQIEAFQAQLLGLTLRNPLLSCPHEERGGAQLRVIDELPDQVFERLVNGDTFRVSPLPRPRDEPDDEDDDEFQARLGEFKATDPMYLAARAKVRRGTTPGRMAAIERSARNVIRLRLSRGDWQPESSLSRDELAQKHDIKPRL